MTTADPSNVTGLVAAASSDELRFHGSSLQRFISGAFASTLVSDCAEAVGNGSLST